MLRGIDRKWRWLAMAVVALTTGLAAAPAQATLLVRSDGNGLAVSDKNNLNDDVFIRSTTLDGRSAYDVFNFNQGDIFKFDRQVGCIQPPNSPTGVKCTRNGPNIRVALAGGNDQLDLALGSNAPIWESVVTGGPGDDQLAGQGLGNDLFDGGFGNDTLRGSGGNDALFGRENADRLEGGSGNDRLIGSEAPDSLFGDLGADHLDGGTNNDFISSKESLGSTAVRDTVICGTGFDTVDADSRDSISTGCEQVAQSPVGEAPHVVLPSKALSVSRSGVARARLRCPAKTTIGCRGKLSLRLAKRGAKRPAKTRYKIAAGKSRSVRVRLTAGEARRVRGRVRGILTSVEKGSFGPKTTIRQPRLR